MNILYLSDNNYAPFLGVSLTSLLINNTELEDISIYIINDGISSENLLKLTSLVNEYGRSIYYLDMSEGLAQLKKLNVPKYRNSYTTYLKLFAFDSLPDTVQRIVFLDSDTVVIDTLKDLEYFDMQNCTIAAVRDCLSNYYKRMLGADEETPWYNMGVMLVDLNAWRHKKYTEKIIGLLTVNPYYVAVDQDILNLCANNDIATLHPKYNYTPHLHVYSYRHLEHYFGVNQKVFYSADTVKDANENPRIVHFERFVGSSAWDKNSIHPFKYYFLQYLRDSKWNDYIEKNRVLPIIIIIEQLIYRYLPESVFLFCFKYGYSKYFKNTLLKMRREKSQNVKF